ncbi:hypothetical protein H9P43_002454 [Blastocladiella emersonii ATCC 22665]|nr:hypothetical protein H9P43_002454 [Blastocladiella emersonii ATCC 22665]
MMKKPRAKASSASSSSTSTTAPPAAAMKNGPASTSSLFGAYAAECGATNDASSPQERTHETPFYFPLDPKRMREVERIKRIHQKNLKKSATAAGAPDIDSSCSPTASLSDFPPGFSAVHLDLAVAAIGGAGSLNTPRAMVSLSITEIKLAQTTAECEGGDSDDDEPPGTGRRAVIFMMWCHATRIAHPLCFFTYGELKSTIVAGRINKIVGQLEDKGFETYTEAAELVSAANPTVIWLPDPLSVVMRLRDAFADPRLTLEHHAGGYIKDEPRLAKLYNITGCSAHGHIQPKANPSLGLDKAMSGIGAHVPFMMRAVLLEPIIAVRTDPSLTERTRGRLLHAAHTVQATHFYVVSMRKYWEGFVGRRERIANLNHTAIGELDEIADFFIEWEEAVNDRVAHTKGSKAARAAFKAKTYIPMATHTALIESIAAFKAAARRLLQAGISPVVPVVFGNTFINDFRADVRIAAKAQQVQAQAQAQAEADPAPPANSYHAYFPKPKPRAAAAAATVDGPYVQIKHIQAVAVKAHAFNAALLRDAAKKHRVPEHYDGSRKDQFLVAMSTPYELRFGLTDEDMSDDEAVARGIMPAGGPKPFDLNSRDALDGLRFDALDD